MGEELERENAWLRQIISDCAASLGNGAHVGPTCSLEFMSHLPNEILLYTSALRDRRDELLAALKPFSIDNKLPSSKPSVIAYNKDGLRCLMSKLEQARIAARTAIAKVEGNSNG